MTSVITGCYHDIITDSHSHVLWNSGWRSNLIVHNCNVLLAALMKGHESIQGILYLAIGEGDEVWDTNRPAPIPATTRLRKEVARNTLKEHIVYLREEQPSETPTDQLEITTIFRGNDFASDQPLREFGLFGGDATDEPDTGYMIDYVIHPRVDLTGDMTLTRKLRLGFTSGGVRRKELTGFGAHLPVVSIDGIGDEYAAKLGENGIYTLSDLVWIDPFTHIDSIPQVRLREFRAKARMVMLLEVNLTPFQALADRSISNILSERPGILAKDSATLTSEIIEQFQEELTVLDIVLDDAHLKEIMLGDMIRI